MIIGVDGNEANVKERVGVSVYTYNLLKFFKKKADRQTRFIIYLKNSPENLPEGTEYYKYQIVPGSFLWSQIFLPLKLYQKKEIDVFFSPAHYLPRFCPVPSVVTIHDLSYLYYPEDFLKKDLYQLKNWTRYSVNKAVKIITVSKTTKKDVIKNYGVNEDKVSVIYNGYEKKSQKYNSKVKSKKPFILFVGTIQPRKNLEVLIDAFNKFAKTNKDYKLVVVGKKGWLYEDIFQKVKEMKLGKKAIFTDHVSDKELVWFYKNAFCLVLPSLYEGFGLPVLEAMSFDCPTIVSYSSSLPEIGGDASLYFDPKNSLELVEQLKAIKDNNQLRNELIEKGKKRIKEFSWEKCGEQTLEILKQAAKK
ncbi:MAG: glycosyltransferase family 1 protein [Candidatus Roizmanbacteria bacterium]